MGALKFHLCLAVQVSGPKSKQIQVKLLHFWRLPCGASFKPDIYCIYTNYWLGSLGIWHPYNTISISLKIREHFCHVFGMKSSCRNEQPNYRDPVTSQHLKADSSIFFFKPVREVFFWKHKISCLSSNKQFLNSSSFTKLIFFIAYHNIMFSYLVSPFMTVSFYALLLNWTVLGKLLGHTPLQNNSAQWH